MNTPTAHRPPHRRLALLLLLTTVSFSLRTPAGAQIVAPVPSVINYQGRVTDGGGVPIGGVSGTTNRKIIFRIYDAATGGTRLWTEEQTVTIAAGEFSVLLGSGINATGTAAGESRPSLEAVFNSVSSSPGGARFLEIMVDEGGGTIDGSDVPISPRQQLTTTAYSFRAKSADSIASGTDLQLNASSDYGLGYYGTGRTFNGTALDGPVLYGLSGGALGSVNGASQSTALRWNAAGQVGVGSPDLSGADATSKLILQGDDSTSPPKHLTIRGNTSTKRLYLGYNTTGNYGALQAYSGTSTTTNLLLNPLGGNVGLGSSTPGFPLTFSDTLGDKISLNGQSGNSYGFGIQSSRLQIHTDGVGSDILFGYGSSAALTETMRIKGNGNVGIGTVGPNEKLEVAGNVRINPGRLTLYNNSGNSSTMTMQAGLLSNEIHGNSGPGTDAGQLRLSAGGETSVANKTAIDLYGFGTNDMRFFTNGTERVRVASGGKVGVGILNPAAKLHVAGPETAQMTLGNPAGVTFAVGNNAGQYGMNFGVNGNGTSWIQGGRTDGTATAYNIHMQAAGGNVGIGVTNPGVRGKLEVSGSAGQYALVNYGYLDVGEHGNIIENAFAGQSSIFADGRITANNYIAFSDERIKRVEGRSDPAGDLATLQGIEITDYTYIDQVSKGSAQHKKVIAQQVEEVFPQAVTRSTGEVPDIYKRASSNDGWVTLVTDLKKGEMVRLIGEKEEGIHEVLEVADGKFRTDFKPEGDEVFVYGRQVKDFLSVDYEAIAMLNVSATQELARKLEAKDAEVKALKVRLAELEAKDQARDAKLVAIEKLLLSADKPAVRTASLKQGGGAE